MLDKADLITTRTMLPSDKNFILAAWLRGLYFGNSWFREIPYSVFMENYEKVIQNLLARKEVTVRIACLKEDQDVILGYCVQRVRPISESAGILVLDWLFVKSAWRKIGIARSLVPEGLIAVTHLTATGRSLLTKRPGVVFNPFLI